MDFRVKTFVPEATRRLEFLTTEYGCAGPEVEASQGLPRFRSGITVKYHQSGLIVETSLTLDYGHDDTVETRLFRSRMPAAGLEETRVGTDTARTGYQMLRALDRQASAVRELLRRN
jgi:hypothetical protein